jgi:hypothetical protein
MDLKNSDKDGLRRGPKLVEPRAAVLMPRLSVKPLKVVVQIAAQTPGFEVEIYLPSDLDRYWNDDRTQHFTHDYVLLVAVAPTAVPPEECD